MSALTRGELAARAGVRVDFLDRAIELGIVTPGEGDASFSPGDLRRMRLINSLDQSGLPPETVATVIRNGDLSLGFFDHPYWERFGWLSAKTYREIATETGVSLDLLAAIHEAMGYARPEPNDPLREDEFAQVNLIKAGLAAGADPAALERQVRVWGESIRRIAEADSAFYHSQIEVPLLRQGMNPSHVMEIGSHAAMTMAPLLDHALLAMYHAQSEHTWLSTVIEDVEAALEKAGHYRPVSQPPAMCFLDLSGYTRLTEERGDEVAAHMAGLLSRLVRRISNEHDGRPVKWLGDGVMLHFKAPGPAVVAALEMVETVPKADLPPAHVGIETGPVIHQDGDYFGRTVNTAARIAGHAGPGEVLVSDSVVNAKADPRVRFEEIGSVLLKGLAQPVRLHRAHWPSRSEVVQP